MSAKPSQNSVPGTRSGPRIVPSDLVRYAAFTRDPTGGNPAGVLVRDELPGDDEMQAIAAEVAYSECAFLAPAPTPGADAAGTSQPTSRWRTRYFAPEAEVPFCGHASIATGVELARRYGPGRFVLVINDGEVPVDVIADEPAPEVGDLGGEESGDRNADTKAELNGDRSADANGDGNADRNAEANAHANRDGNSYEASALRAVLTSVEPWVLPAPDDLVDRALSALGWTEQDLAFGGEGARSSGSSEAPGSIGSRRSRFDSDDLRTEGSSSLWHDLLAERARPAIAFAGARHLVLVLRSRETLAALDYDFDALRAVALEHEIVTFQLAWPETPTLWHVRNPFPHGGVVEDPATGAAAAALGAHVRHFELVHPPATLELHQGDDMDRPSRLTVDLLPADVDPRLRVSGYAVPIS